MTRFRIATVVVLACFLLAITACGQMGPLTLPGDAPNGEEDESDDENE